ncbi:uncharacterized protein LOC124945877 [Impatiens glandulifera]|uniref:uncharacterized protein LOC124945877 n=1 Tax=Impatiens glandulifera TaxID=253017 RepID=UPI001FB18487|nr:uncharacterized protein LOC124945877 [Impatiens glandulifera]XP_047342350.1 uncharacterized protein LOC124945877 [Impatiens glandulifera]
MDFFTKFTKTRKPSLEIGLENESETPKDENVHCEADVGEEDEDDDFITNEVKRRLKELRRNSFMVLIPEESSSMEGEDEEDDDLEVEMNYNECRRRNLEEDNQLHAFHMFDKMYDKYCDRMLVFDRLSSEHLKLVGGFNGVPSTPSPRSGSKKLALPFRCLSLKPEAEYETEQLIDLHQDLETSYVSQICLTWEVLHSHYTQLSCQTEQSIHYNYIAEQFQQFQVLLQRYIENEPFEHGSRVEIYARARNSMPKLLQVPDIRVSDSRGLEVEQSDLCVAADNCFIRVIESSIMTFQLFLKFDNKKSSGGRNLFGGGAQNQMAIPIREIRSSVEQKQLRLKELRKRKKSWKKKSWPTTGEEVDLLFGLIEIKLLLRVLRTEKITKEQLLWCDEKMKKIEISDGKLQRDPSPILFPC